MSELRVFKRELSDEFIRDLTCGHLAPLMDAARSHGLDVQLRGECEQCDYINVYHRGYSALKLAHRPRAGYQGEVSSAFISETRWAPGGPVRVTIPLGDSGAVEAYVQELPAILASIETMPAGERHAEGCLFRASQASASPVVFIDRQVSQSHRERREQVDLVGLTRDASRFMLAEVKYGRGSTIRQLVEQLRRYIRFMTDGTGSLRPEFHDSYARVLEQRQRLGLSPAELAFPAAPAPVEGLIILCDYKRRVAAETVPLGFPVWRVEASGPDYAVPCLDAWEPVR